MNRAPWRHFSRPGLLAAVIASSLGVGAAQSQQAKPTDEDVDRAIRVCSLGTKTDAQVEGGLNLLKRRILTGEGKFSYSEIPSVVGTSVQTDEAKINIFDRIQKCVVDQVYGGRHQGSRLDARSVCGSPSEEVSNETKGDLQGKAQTFARVATGELSSAASSAKKDIEVRENRSDAARELHYLNYLSCVLIYQDDVLSTDEKLRRVNVLRAALKPTTITANPAHYPSPGAFGFDVACKSIEPSADVQVILRRFGEQALSDAPAARIASIGRPVYVRPSVGGDDYLGAIPPNTRVRVICTEEDGRFAVIKQEKGNRDGVVESRALEKP